MQKKSNKFEELQIGPGSASIDPAPEIETPPPKSGNMKKKKLKAFQVKEDLVGKPTPSAQEIAKKHKMDLKDVHVQIAKGAKVEREHTNSHAAAAEIARDHIAEFPDYYSRLKKMEKSAKKKIKEQMAMSVGAGNIAGMPTASPPEQTPVRVGPMMRRKKPIKSFKSYKNENS